MYDFEAEYRGLFEKPLEEIQQDIFFRADNFQNEKWYGELQIYLAIGICQTDRDCASDLQKALKVLGYPTQAKERNGRLFVVPQREIQKHPHRKHEDLTERELKVGLEPRWI